MPHTGAPCFAKGRFFETKKRPCEAMHHTGAPFFEKGRFFEKKNAPARQRTTPEPPASNKSSNISRRVVGFVEISATKLSIFLCFIIDLYRKSFCIMWKLI